jgi:hypothetical protein
VRAGPETVSTGTGSAGFDGNFRAPDLIVSTGTVTSLKKTGICLIRKNWSKIWDLQLVFKKNWLVLKKNWAGPAGVQTCLKKNWGTPGDRGIGIFLCNRCKLVLKEKTGGVSLGSQLVLKKTGGVWPERKLVLKKNWLVLFGKTGAGPAGTPVFFLDLLL